MSLYGLVPGSLEALPLVAAANQWGDSLRCEGTGQWSGYGVLLHEPFVSLARNRARSCPWFALQVARTAMVGA